MSNIHPVSVKQDIYVNNYFKQEDNLTVIYISIFLHLYQVKQSDLEKEEEETKSSRERRRNKVIKRKKVRQSEKKEKKERQSEKGKESETE